MPSIKHTVRDEQNNVTYHVMAYRQLSEQEVLASVKYYLSQPKMRRRKKPERDKEITIISLYGATPNL